jgi:hypothetical protein
VTACEVMASLVCEDSMSETSTWKRCILGVVLPS